MCLYTHIAVGALAGSYGSGAYFAAAYGLASHVVLDLFPHFDFDKVKHEVLLGAVCLLAVVVLTGGRLEPVVGGMAAALPDLENLFWKRGLITDDHKVFPSHSRLMPHGRDLGPRNLLPQGMLSLGTLMLLAIA